MTLLAWEMHAIVPWYEHSLVLSFLDICVMQVYVPRFFVSSQQRFGATDIKALGALGSWTNHATALKQINVTAPFYLEDSRRIQDSKRREWRSVQGRERESERERERKSTRTRERESVRKHFGSSFYMFFSSNWACPMQIGLSQECCLFCLKSSLWSSDLPWTFLVF